MCNWLHLPRNLPEFFYRLVRGAVYAFTFILCILSISIVIFSFWYIYEGKNYHLDNTIKFGVFGASFVLGFVVLALSTCGLLGALKENLFLAKLFLAGTVILMVAEIVIVFLIYSYKREILKQAGSLFKKFISEYFDDSDLRYMVDKIQSDLKCCGISSPSDWNDNPYYNCNSISTFACSVPASCCYNYASNEDKFNMFCGIGLRRNESIHKMYKMIHVTGCKYSIYSFLDYKHKLTASILVGILVPQLIGIVLIISFIISLNYLIQYDSIEHSNHTLQFKRKHDLDIQIKPYEEPIDTNKKNLFILSIGSNRNLMKRSFLNSNFLNDDGVAEDYIDSSSSHVKIPDAFGPPEDIRIEDTVETAEQRRQKIAKRLNSLDNFKQFIESTNSYKLN